MVIFSGSKQDEVSISKDGEGIAIARLYRNSYLLSAKASKEDGPQSAVVTAKGRKIQLEQEQELCWNGMIRSGL